MYCVLNLDFKTVFVNGFYSLTMVFQPSSEVYGYTGHALVKDGDKMVCS